MITSNGEWSATSLVLDGCATTPPVKVFINLGPFLHVHKHKAMTGLKSVEAGDLDLKSDSVKETLWKQCKPAQADLI